MVFMWPLAGKVEVAFAVDELVYSKTMADWRTHPGLDIAAAIGTKVLAVTDGIVIDVFADDMLGTTVIVDHGHGVRSSYANLAAAPVVKVGDKIAMGSVIGAVGDTALGEIGQASHLHLEMTKDGDAENPVWYLPSR